MYFRPETIVASFLHLMALLFKALLNHNSKRQFLALHCRKTIAYLKQRRRLTLCCPKIEAILRVRTRLLADFNLASFKRML